MEPLTRLERGNEAGCLERGRVADGQGPKVSGAWHVGEWAGVEAVRRVRVELQTVGYSRLWEGT